MPQVMYPAQSGPGAVPLMRSGAYTGTDIAIGSVLVFNSGNLALASADPALIAGVALQAYDTAPGFQAANNPVPITGRTAKITYAVADKNTTLCATLTNGSSTRIAPVAADVGAQYGITAYSGVWTVDKNKTAGDARIQVTAIDLERNLVLFKWLTDHIAGDA